MKTFKAIVGILAMLIISSQLFRHLYVRFVEPRDSVLVKFEPTRQEIAASKSLDELLDLYQPVLEQVRAEDAKAKIDEESDRYYRRRMEEPYKSEEQLKAAILEWENHHRKLIELHFFWWSGMLAVCLGVICFWRSKQLLGASLFLLGYLEMIWATSPSLQSFGYPLEFERLLTFKVIYSAASLLLLLLTWRYLETKSTDTTVASPTS